MHEVLQVTREIARDGGVAVNVILSAPTTSGARRLLLDANYTLCGFDEMDAAATTASAAASSAGSPGATGEPASASASAAVSAGSDVSAAPAADQVAPPAATVPAAAS